jgi:hypothetical protein
MPTPVNLTDAILQHLADDSAVATAVPGGFWGDEAPPDEVFPFAVIAEPDAPREYQSEANPADGVPCDDRVTIQLTIYATGRAAARSAALVVRTSLNDAPLTFDGGELLYLRAGNLAISKDPDKAEGGADVWAAMLTFSAIVSSFT